MQTTDLASVAESPGDDESGARRHDLTFSHDSTLKSEITALRDLAATLDYAARVLERLLPAGRTDVRADIALLRMVAGNARGYCRTMEADDG